MIEKISLDMLTQDSVSVRKQQFVIVGEVEYAIGEPWRRAFVNSISGRAQVQAEVSEPYASVILLMWGSEPTVSDVIE